MNDSLLDKLLIQWQKIVSCLQSLNNLTVPRCYFDLNYTVAFSQLHSFSEALDQAFAATVYLHSSYSIGSVEVRNVEVKTRVDPIKKLSIPHPELLGAEILVRLVMTIFNLHPKNFLWSTGLIWWQPFIGSATINHGSSMSIITLQRSKEYHHNQLGDIVLVHSNQQILLHEESVERNYYPVIFGEVCQSTKVVKF